MEFYIYSAVLPIILIAIVFWFYRPLDFQRIAKATTVTVFPLAAYISLVYFLQMENYIDAGWVYWTLMFFFIPYLALILVLNIMAWSKRRKA